MALSDTDLHWIPMNRSKFDQLRRMFDGGRDAQMPVTSPTSPCDKCTSPRIRYTTAENVTALAQIRALLRPVETRDDSSTSSRSRTGSEESTCGNRVRGDVIVIDPLLCSKSTIAENTENTSTTCNMTTQRTRTIEPDGSLVIEQPDIVNISDLCLSKPETVVSEGDDESLQNGHIVVTNGHAIEEERDEEVEEEESLIDEEIRANNIFLKMVNDTADFLSAEREYFLQLIEEASSVSEEAGGRVMACCGKANLLLTSKFKQYRELCYEYEKTTRKVTADDMQGFWELILLQVDDIKATFITLHRLKSEHWIIPKSPMPKKRLDSHTVTPVKKKVAPKGKSAAAKARDDERRRLLAAKRQEMKAKLAQTTTPEILIT